MAGFEPILGTEPQVLILGSMPSQISLQTDQYYANPRNAFWWIMSELFRFDLNLDYHSRSLKLLEAGIAVWDVLHDCQRPGSLDSAIVKNSEVPNDFSALLDSHPSISHVVFNGAAAETIFRRHNKVLIEDYKERKPSFAWHRCPSTSPAHASINKHDKLNAWRNAIF